MIGHIGVNVSDLAAARVYYDELMPLLGFEMYLDAADQFAFRPAGGKPGTYLFFYPALAEGGYDRHRAGLQHLAFMVRSRSAVRAVHDWVVGMRGNVLHKPRNFPEYPPPYYATFWVDPFGFMLEAVCHHDRP
ncbi:VOC family protein [Nonomuraea typhae]|uniref:VOC family protein n=1 Tax=Nonomuraea typhae TaxID=2603600 RepID=UPI0012FBCB84|nr:VOC family protein [Nonomuraea typhae]